MNEDLLPGEHPWKPEKELWPIPSWIPPHVASTFPGDEAVELLLGSMAAVAPIDDVRAREGAIGFVNYRRRTMVAELSGPMMN
jgi:hypothetical protein